MINLITKEILWKTVKEPLRLLVLAIIPLAIVYAGNMSYEWAGVLIVVLRLIDKYMHELGKIQKSDILTKGLTRF